MDRAKSMCGPEQGLWANNDGKGKIKKMDIFGYIVKLYLAVLSLVGYQPCEGADPSHAS